MTKRLGENVVNPHIAVLCGSFAIIGGLLTLIGWFANIQTLADWDNDGIAMFPNTALCAVLMGIASILFAISHRRYAIIIGLCSGAIGAATLFEHITGVDLKIDHILILREWGQRAAANPGRMGPPASIAFTLLGAALLFSGFNRTTRRLAAGFTVVVGSIGMLSIVGYIFREGSLFAQPHFTGIALQTSIILVALAVGICSILNDVEPVKTLREDSAAGTLVRRTFVLIFILPIVLGWLRLEGQYAGWFDSQLGTTLRTLAEMAILAWLLWWSAAAVRAQETPLRRQATQLATFLDTAAICLHRVGPDGTILWANDAELKTLGYEHDEYIGRHIAEFHADADVIQDILERLHRGERIVNREARLKCKDGAVKTVLIDSSVLRDEGRFIHTQCFTRDITEQKCMEQTLRDADRRKDEFLATLAHELRNPLAPVRLAAKILNRTDAPPDKQQEARQIVERQIVHMIRLIDDLLDASRVNTGKLNLCKENVTIQSVIASTLESSRPIIEASNHKLTIVLPDAPIYLDADPFRLAQVFSNLLNNAAKYMEQGGAIRLSVETSGHEVMVRIKDIGIGISPEHLPHIFKMFSQANTARTRSQGGLGIGLSLVKSLVELHGGAVEGRSDGLGKGSEFIVSLPITSHLVPSNQKKSQVITGITQKKRLRIMVVDDNRDITEMLTLFLKVNGHEVEMAESGAECLRIAETFRPNVLVLDIGMPDMDGCELCRRIRSMAWAKDALLIAQTGYGSKNDELRSREAGFDAHLVKPIDPDQLIVTIERLHAARKTDSHFAIPATGS